MQDPIDPKHEMVHKVPGMVLDAYKLGVTPNVVHSVCGKVWSPTIFKDFGGMPKCPQCFPKRYQFAIAA